MQADELQKLLLQAAEREKAHQASELIETQIKVLTVVFDKSTAYTNLIVFAGYAGFFGLWQITKDYLPKSIALCAALLMLISIVCFVLFEVVKMVVTSRDIILKANALKSPEAQKDPQVLTGLFEEIGNAHERVNFYLMRFWVVALAITLGTGLTAAGLLAYAFVIGL